MMKEQPLVSILMTAYNREKYIGEAIQSVLNSTYQNFEIIITDDCSTDKTVEIARDFASKDKRIKVYVNEKNLGDYPNRNKAASYAKGKYIKYVDADDAIYYWGLQVVVEMMERFPEAAYGLDSILQDDHRMFPYILSPEEAYVASYTRKLSLFEKAPTSSIIRLDIFNKENGFKEYKMVSDCEMWHRLSLHHSVLVMPDGIVWSRAHEQSESTRWIKDLATNYHYILIRRIFLLSSHCPLPNKLKKSKISQMATEQLKIICKALVSFDFKTVKHIRRLDNIKLIDLLRLI